MEILQNLLEHSQFPIVTAFILGLMTAISPCPLATNITAIGFISKEISSRKKVFPLWSCYTLGRAITYTGLGLIFFFGANQFEFASFLQKWGRKNFESIADNHRPYLCSELSKINFLGTNSLVEKISKNTENSFWKALLLGIFFALAFCPYSGVLYFGMLIPMSVASPDGLFLPAIFALATGLPVIFFAWLIAFGLWSIGKIYDKIKIFELWFRRTIACLFIAVGIYYIITTYL